MNSKGISYEYIRGLVEGEGCFTFTPVSFRDDKGVSHISRRIPTFVIGMSQRDEPLLTMVKSKLGLRNRIYRYRPEFKKDGDKRQGRVAIKVRDIGQLKNIIVPLFYNKLIGNKGSQFLEWIERIGTDPLVSSGYKIIYSLHRLGYYKKHEARFQ